MGSSELKQTNKKHKSNGTKLNCSAQWIFPKTQPGGENLKGGLSFVTMFHFGETIGKTLL